MSGNAISDLVEIAPSTIYDWIRSYRDKGRDGLVPSAKGGRPRTVDYENLAADLAEPPTTFGHNSAKWTADLIRDHIRTSQGQQISSSHVYHLLSELGLSLKCNGINCQLPKELQTVRGDLITPLHVEVMTEASIMLDAPIARIIGSRGIKPVLKMESQSKERIVLKGETEQGVLTLMYEEYDEEK